MYTKERPNLQQEEDSIKNTTADKINKLLIPPGKIASSFEFRKYPIEKLLCCNYEAGYQQSRKRDSDAAGFYNITTKDLMKKSKVLLSILIWTLRKSRQKMVVLWDAFKEKILSLPKIHIFRWNL